jgi:molybdopterin-biosynthesis enzyme MoeA-like protein
VFPGVPQIFKHKFPVMRNELKDSSRFYSRAVYVNLDEPALAPLLDRVAAAHPHVNIGSYLYWGDDSDYRTKLTVDGRDEAEVVHCFEALLTGIPAGSIVRQQ